VSRYRRRASIRAWPRRTGAGRGSGAAVAGGSGSGQAVDRLGQGFHAQVVQEPAEPGQPGRRTAGAQRELDLVDRVPLVQFPVRVAAQRDLPGERGEHRRLVDPGVPDQQLLRQLPGVVIDLRRQLIHRAHDGAGLLDTDRALGQRGAQQRQHRWGFPTGGQVTGQHRPRRPHPRGGVTGGNVQRLPQQRPGRGAPESLGDPAGVDLAGQLNLRGVHQPPDPLHQLRQRQQTVIGNLPELTVPQRIQVSAHRPDHLRGLRQIRDTPHEKNRTTHHRQRQRS